MTTFLDLARRLKTKPTTSVHRDDGHDVLKKCYRSKLENENYFTPRILTHRYFISMCVNYVLTEL